MEDARRNPLTATVRPKSFLWRRRIGLAASILTTLVFCFDHSRLPPPEQIEKHSTLITGNFLNFTRRSTSAIVEGDKRIHYSIDCESAQALCRHLAATHADTVYAEVVRISILGSYFATTARVDEISVLTAHDASIRYKKVRSGHFVQLVLVSLTTVAIFFYQKMNA